MVSANLGFTASFLKRSVYSFMCIECVDKAPCLNCEKAQQNLLKLRYFYGVMNNWKCMKHQKTYAMLQNFKKVEFGCNEKEDIDTNG